MSKIDTFLERCTPHAARIQLETGLHRHVTLTQAALESAWGECAPGHMYFGVKDRDGLNGNEQLLTTTEYHTRIDVKYPVVISITPEIHAGKKRFRYRVKDYFRKYPSPYESFLHHVSVLKHERYAVAWMFRDIPDRCLKGIAAAGYATDPNYLTKLLKIYDIIRSRDQGH